MGSAQSYIVASLSACSVYLGYVCIYCSYKLLKTNVLNGDNLPSFLYLYIKYWTRALTRRTGYLYATPKTGEAVYTVLKCRWASSTSIRGKLFKLCESWALHVTSSTCWVSVSVFLRLETHLLRRFCSAAGYGWDYPDTEFRDIPLCVPEFLCGRLLLIVLTDENFRLSPAGRRFVQPIGKQSNGHDKITWSSGLGSWHHALSVGGQGMFFNF